MKIKITPMVLFRTLFLIAMCMSVLNIFKFQSVISLLFVFMFPLVIALLIMSSKSNKKVDISVVSLLILIAMSLVFSTVSLLLSDRSFALSNLNKAVIFCTTVTFFFSVNRLKIDRKTTVFIERVVTITSLIFVVMYFVMADKLYIYMTNGVRFLYFNFNNPNFASMHFLVFAIYNMIIAQKEKNVFLKLVHWGLVLFMIYFIVATLSRNTLIISVLFIVVFSVVKLVRNFPLFINRPMSIVISSWPLVFAFIYMAFISAVSNIGFLSFMVDSSKPLDSRFGVWSKALTEIEKFPLTGNYSFSLIRQSHNTHLDIWVSYGFIVLLITIVFLTHILFNKGQEYKDKTSYLYMLGFSSCIIMGMAEAALFAGCQGLFVMVGAFILLSKADSDEEEIIPAPRVKLKFR